MKKTNKKNSTMRKLLPAFAMLTVSAISLTSATYAWFTMNKTVEVTGMEVRTTVSSNLLISPDGTLTSTAKNAESTFTTSDTTQIKAWLQPASSDTAATSNFWYTLNANADGSKSAGNYTDYDSVGLGNATDTSTYANKFSEEYGVTKTQVTGFGATTTPNNAAVGYVDYIFQLKATNTTGSNEKIYLTDLKLTYGKDTDGDKAFRTAVFCEEFSSAFSGDITTAANFKGIYAPASADNHTAGAAVSGANATTAITNFMNGGTDAATELATINAGDTKYYKVVVRLWIEGEDTTCTSETFANLTDTWSLDLRLDLGALSGTTVNGHTPVNELAMATTATKTALATSDAVNTTAAYTISGVSYYEVTGKTLGSAKLYVTSTTITTSSRVFTITDGLYPVDVTNQVTIS